MSFHHRLRRAATALIVVSVSATVLTFTTSPAGAEDDLRPLGALPTTTVSLPLEPRAGAPEFPASVDLRPWVTPVGDQGSVGSCVGWAIGYALAGWYARHDGRSQLDFAPMYLYSQINGGVDRGSVPTDAFRVLYEQGIERRANYWQGDYNWWTLPDANQISRAAKWRISGYEVLFTGAGRGIGAAGVRAVKGALAGGDPVAITLGVRPGFDALFNNNDATATDFDTTGRIRGYHAVVAVAYDDRGVIVQNSWGTGWGNGGFGRISWGVVAADVDSAITMAGFVNRAPSAIDATTPFRAGTTQSRSVTRYASDPDGDRLTYQLLEIGFRQSSFNFSWDSSAGSFRMTVPPGNSGKTYLKYRVHDPKLFFSRTVTLIIDFVI